MEPGNIALIITILLITIIPMMISTAISQRSYTHNPDNITNQKFIVSKLLYVGNILSILGPVVGDCKFNCLTFIGTL